jgi:hypothetical protein
MTTGFEPLLAAWWMSEGCSTIHSPERMLPV